MDSPTSVCAVEPSCSSWLNQTESGLEGFRQMSAVVGSSTTVSEPLLLAAAVTEPLPLAAAVSEPIFEVNLIDLSTQQVRFIYKFKCFTNNENEQENEEIVGNKAFDMIANLTFELETTHKCTVLNIPLIKLFQFSNL
ncbi:unnamed protein product [Rotaria socialis]|uniref:Uncharacterized protein n=1 Tax=Rotaria socialis TaxID=392032 RepID=A0A821T538_9BILA|nr:unnamed protein product [Rotaria socialis]